MSRLVSGEPAPQESYDRALRPQTLAEFTGQAPVKANLKVFIDAARARAEPLDHVLLFGPPGLGKTTLAQIVARELGVSFRATSGPVLAKPGDLAAILTNLEPRDVLFIDEVHRLPVTVEEILYPAMEDHVLDLVIGEGPSARSVQIPLNPFTLVAATTRAGLLANPQALDVLLTASGLGNQGSYTALAQKALLSNTNDPNGLANQLSSTNTLWKTTAKTYDFANQGLALIQKAGVASTIANAYAEVTWRQSLDSTTPGLSNALTFRAGASALTSVDQILGDATARTVVTGALGIPPEIAYQDIGAQEQAISSRLDLKKLQDPKFVEGLVQQYLISAQGSTTSGSGGIDALAVQNQGLVV